MPRGQPASSQQPLTQKTITLTFALGPQPENTPSAPLNSPRTFPGTNADTVTILGLRCSANITIAGGISLGALQLTAYGMTPDQMNTLSTLGMKVIIVPRSTVTVQAGNAGSALTQVYQGGIIQAYTDYSGMPEVAFRVEAAAGYYTKVGPAPPLSTQTTAVATIMASLAQQAGVAAGIPGGYPLHNFGVTATASPQYLWGSYWDQMGALAKAYRFNLQINHQNSPNTIDIWPIGASKQGNQQIPLISPDTGMVGYPSFTAQGIIVRTQFNPALSFGTQVQVESSIPQANKTYYIAKLGHTLDAMVPNGSWFTDLALYELGYQVVTQ